MNEQRRWVQAGAVHDVPLGGARLYKGEGGPIAIFRPDETTLYAVDNRCPHEGYPLDKGWLSAPDGSALACVVTCPWHNFKFDLRDGRCLLGDEAVRTFPLRVREGQVELDVTPPDPAVELPRLWRSLAEATLANKLGQMARDVVRLLSFGVTPERIALEACVLDAAYAELGTTHVMPVAVDVLRMAPRYPGERAVLPLLQPFELCADSHARRPRRSVPPGLERVGAADAGERLVDLVERERAAEAEALLRAALAAGHAQHEVERWLYRLCAAHFLDFGHALIYQVKIFELLERVGWQHAPALLPSFVFGIVNGTREELLPEWLWFRRLWDERIAPRAAELMAPERLERARAAEDPSELVAALCDARREDAVEATVDALDRGMALTGVVDAISAAAAERILRFATDVDRDATVQEGWLDVTHTLTFAAALRRALERWREPAALKLVAFGARFVAAARPLDMPPAERLSLAPRDVPADPASAVDMVMTAILHKRTQEAVSLAAGYLAAGLPIDPLRIALEDACLDAPATRPLVVAHAIKTCVAAFDEHAAMRANDRPAALRDRPVLAVVRLLSSPIHERRVAQRAHEALRFVVEGKVPRTLT